MRKRIRSTSVSTAEITVKVIDYKSLPWWLVLLPLAAVLLFMLGGCSKGEGGGVQAAGGKNGKERRGPRHPPVPVAIATASSGRISSYYAATATLVAEKQAEVLARVNGVALELACEEGDWVSAGQRLLSIEDAEYRLRLRLAQANTARLQDRFNRLSTAGEKDLVSAEEFEALRSDLKAAQAAEELAQLNLSYTEIKAPFNGRVVKRYVDVGQNITSGMQLFAIADFSPLLAIIHVPAKEFRKLQLDQPVQVTLDSNKQRMSGRVKLISPVINPNSGTIKVTVEIEEYPAGTRPGDFAEVSIVTEVRDGATLVPKIAVFSDRGDQIIYVAADSTAERRVVEVGFTDDDNAEILDGVSDGEPVIVKGQRSLKHGSSIKIIGDDPVAKTQEPKTAAGDSQQPGS